MNDLQQIESFFSKVQTEPYHVYVDGACSGNPGPGGWGILILSTHDTFTLSGGQKQTTNNRMELTAAIEAIKVFPKNQKFIIYTDSQYVKDGITSWIKGWKKKGWMNSKNEEVKNKDLWMQLDQLAQEYVIEWKWVRGHAGNEYNERVDLLAKRAIIALQVQ